MKPQRSHFEAQCLKTAGAILSNRELFPQSEVDAALSVMRQLAGKDQPTRRRFLMASAAITAVAVLSVVATAALAQATTAAAKYADPSKPTLPPSTMQLDLARTALVVTDPQIDFLSSQGVMWAVVGESVEQHNTVENIGHGTPIHHFRITGPRVVVRCASRSSADVGDQARSNAAGDRRT